MDHNGFWLYYRHPERGTLQLPEEPNSTPLKINRLQLRWLLDGLSLGGQQAYPEVTSRRKV
nr:IS66 family insertion sequence element accessory protein TnpB [Thermicanus aegyptius]